MANIKNQARSTEEEVRALREKLNESTAHDEKHEEAIRIEADRRNATEKRLTKYEEQMVQVIDRLSTAETGQKDLTSKVGSVESKLGSVDERVKSVEAETKLQTESLKGLTDSVARLASSVGAVVDEGKKFFANPRVRSAVVVFLTSIGSTGGVMAYLKGCQPTAVITTTTVPATVAVPITPTAVAAVSPVAVSPELTPYERDVAACGASAACEESVRARFGRATPDTMRSFTRVDAGRP